MRKSNKVVFYLWRLLSRFYDFGHTSLVKYTILVFDLSQKVNPYPLFFILELLSAHMKLPYIKKLENQIRDFYHAQNPLNRHSEILWEGRQFFEYILYTQMLFLCKYSKTKWRWFFFPNNIFCIFCYTQSSHLGVGLRTLSRVKRIIIRSKKPNTYQ